MLVKGMCIARKERDREVCFLIVPRIFNYSVFLIEFNFFESCFYLAKGMCLARKAGDREVGLRCKWSRNFAKLSV